MDIKKEEKEEKEEKNQDEQQVLELSKSINCNIGLVAKYESLAKIAFNTVGTLIIVSPMITAFLMFLYLNEYHSIKLMSSVIDSVSNIGYISIIGFVYFIILIVFSFSFWIYFFIFYNKKPINTLEKYYNKNYKIKTLIVAMLSLFGICYDLYIYYNYLNNLIEIFWLFLVFSFLILIFMSFLFFYLFNFINKENYIKINYSWILLLLLPPISFLYLFTTIFSINPVSFNAYHYKLSLLILLFFISFFNASGLFMTTKRKKNDNKTFDVIIIFIIILFLSSYFISYPKLAIQSIGSGHFQEKINLKPNAPKYLIKELKKTKLNDKSYFVLIQSANNIYIVKNRKDCEKPVRALSEKYCRIIKLPRKYIK